MQTLLQSIDIRYQIFIFHIFYFKNFVDYVVKVLRSVCADCSAILIPESDIKEQSLGNHLNYFVSFNSTN